MTAYKNIVIKNSTDVDVLELQHQRIEQLEMQLEVMSGKYSKLVKSGGVAVMTEYERKCQDYERRLKEAEREHLKEVAGLKAKLAKQSALEFV